MKNARKGFTLVKLLVALMAICALVSVSAMAGIDAGLTVHASRMAKIFTSYRQTGDTESDTAFSLLTRQFISRLNTRAVQ